ncbi:LysM peptidoglycan-binding domain-containing M23 family metallopeptidase [Parvularcula sp. IMCC14364]|uniref:LysM peptidoglycan-binding domain-containing M23 family metallopeptidase n=1 Tax=Parvularcula sp. IMCC14364 TaxID=3067902 RepID=UPI002741D49B|nr:LysM peptidoglycan-binding domain-containing M23 family metallopeptidase [Parvularcula sp. IMCC14364]
MRAKIFLLAGSVSFLGLTAFAEEQGAPVEFATDPGKAHPKYIEQALATGSDARIVAASADQSIEAMMASEPIYDTVDQSQIMQGQTADRGGFDYGYASNELDMAVQTSVQASGRPTPLVQGRPASATAMQQVAMQAPVTQRPYQKDPIYQVAENSQGASSATATAGLSQGYIRVQPGDTVYALSRRCGIKANSIIAANQLPAPYALQVGQVLLIPGLGQPEIQQAQYTPPPQPQPAAPIPQPVSQPRQQAAAQSYVVRPGNTLYSISRAYGLDVATVAIANGLTPPYTLSVGQRLTIPSAGQPTAAMTQSAPTQPVSNANRNTYVDPQAGSSYRREAAAPVPDAPKSVSYAVPEKSNSVRFDWPIQGMVVMGYGLAPDGRRNDGINIAAPVGTPIRATADGEVVYRGSDLEGYGNLLLVKHAGGWVSAYAHTDAMLVRKGENVRKGQVIAKVGTTGTVDQPQLHFELRHDLKPKDPLAALEGKLDTLAQ